MCPILLIASQVSAFSDNASPRARGWGGVVLVLNLCERLHTAAQNNLGLLQKKGERVNLVDCLGPKQIMNLEGKEGIKTKYVICFVLFWKTLLCSRRCHNNTKLQEQQKSMMYSISFIYLYCLSATWPCASRLFVNLDICCLPQNHEHITILFFCCLHHGLSLGPLSLSSFCSVFLCSSCGRSAAMNNIRSTVVWGARSPASYVWLQLWNYQSVCKIYSLF